MNDLRGFIRRYARRDNRFGFSCSLLLSLLGKGPASAGTLLAERRWITRERKNASRFLRFPEEELRRQREASAVPGPLFSVVSPLYNTPPAFLREMIDSVLAQTYPRWELCLADGSDEAHAGVSALCREYAARDPRIRYTRLIRNGGISANTNACIAMAAGDYIALLDHDDLLTPDALCENARAIRETGADFLYSDEFVFLSPDPKKILKPHFKPDFSPEAILTNNYICHLSVFSKSLLDQTEAFRPEYDGSQDHDLILRLTDKAAKVAHIPKPLYLWRSHADSVASDISAKTYAVDAGRNAVRSFLASKGIDARVDSAAAFPAMYHVRYPVPGDPSVCVVLDLYDAAVSPDDLMQSLKTLETRAGCGRLSFAVILKDGATPAAAPGSLRFFPSSEPCRPKRLNQVIQETATDYLLLLYPSLRCDSDRWLLEMLMLARQPAVGAVGARLLFDDRRVRHAGLVLGLGKQRLVGRLFYRFSAERPGLFGQIAVVQDLSAVSGECLLVSREKFDLAGGFSEQYENSLFDVDFCLRLRKLGYRNVYCPFSVFAGGNPCRVSPDYGAESETYSADAAALRSAWPNLLSAPDPFYNPNLSLDHTDYRSARR